MAEYIKREAAYETLTEYYHHTTQTMHDALREALDRVPSADVQPVRHGRWGEGAYAGYRCPICKTTWDAPTNYCPNCGCCMDLEEDNER